MAIGAKGMDRVHDTQTERLRLKVASNAIAQGGQHASLSHATGVYTFTLTYPQKRLLYVSAPGLLTAGLRHEITTATASSVVISLFGYADTTPTDGDFFLEIVTSKNSYDR